MHFEAAAFFRRCNSVPFVVWIGFRHMSRWIIRYETELRTQHHVKHVLPLQTAMPGSTISRIGVTFVVLFPLRPVA